MSKIFTFFLLFFIVTSLQAQEVTAPFGLKWGDTKSNIEQQGLTLSCKNLDSLEQCTTNQAIKPVSFGDIYVLVFAQGKGLQKVVLGSVDITDDPFGTEGKELYSTIKQSLINKYGAPSKHQEIVGLDLYDEHDEFYQCLSYRGCGLWMSFWDKQGFISLEIEGGRRGQGYVKLTYESSDWPSIVDDNESKQKSSDSNAL